MKTTSIFVEHATEYVRGQIHTNGIENFWSLLKRGIKGTYVSVEPFHLFRYLDEQTYRYDFREDNDFGRFKRVSRRVEGRRMTYKKLTASFGEREIRRIRKDRSFSDLL